MREIIKQSIQDHATLAQNLLSDELIIAKIEDVSQLIISTYNNDSKVLMCGNGGSAADAQHLAAELSGRFYKDRAPLNAEALHVNTSFLTAVANDMSFKEVFSRAVKAKGAPGDLLFAISTSGTSENIFIAAKQARDLNMKIVSLTGNADTELSSISDINIQIQSDDTARIQEMQILIGHIICQIVEEKLFPSN